MNLVLLDVYYADTYINQPSAYTSSARSTPSIDPILGDSF